MNDWQSLIVCAYNLPTGCRGTAVTFLHPCELGFVGRVRSRGVTIEEVALPNSVTSSFFHLQRVLMGQVQASRELQELAAAGFQSYIRAYAAVPSALRDVFHYRKLHLGHVAHSFGLRKKPSNLRGAFRASSTTQDDSTRRHAKRQRRR